MILKCDILKMIYLYNMCYSQVIRIQKKTKVSHGVPVKIKRLKKISKKLFTAINFFKQKFILYSILSI